MLRLSLVSALTLLLLPACRRAQGKCAGTQDGASIRWSIDGESFLRPGENASAWIAYDLSPTLHYALDVELKPTGVVLPHQQDLAKDGSGQLVTPTLVTGWAEERMDPEVGTVPWPVEPARRLTVDSLGDDGMTGELLLRWPSGDEVTCGFDLPADEGKATPGKSGPTPCGFHGCG